MAEKRMFAKTIVLSDAFLDMPLSARCLYFTLGMLADDDGFINNPKSIMRQCGASEDDLRVLLGKKFLLAFETGVIVIKHWRINNYLRNDRYNSTKYVEEKEQLEIEENGAYTFIESGIPKAVYPDKLSIDKISIVKNSSQPPAVGDKPRKAKNSKASLFDYINEYTQDEQLRQALNKYLGFKLSHSRGFSLDQWRGLLDELTKYCPGDVQKLNSVNNAYVHGWQALAYPPKNNSYSKQAGSAWETSDKMSDEAVENSVNLWRAQSGN